MIKGKITAYQVDHFMPAMQDDRLVGAVLASMPTQPAPDVNGDFISATANAIQDGWLYAGAANVIERAMAHSRWDKRTLLSPSVCVTTACVRLGSFNRTIRANSR